MSIKGYKADIWILISVIALIVFSIGAVYSASSYFSAMTKNGDSEYYAKMHLIKIVLAIILIFLFAKFDYNKLKKISIYIVWGSVLLLIIVFFFGTAKKGASRWIPLGPISFQPSDVAKYALVIHVSYLLMKKKEYVDFLYKGYLHIFGYIFLITLLVAVQPNFSTSLIIFGSSMLILFVSPVKMKHIMVTVISFIPVAIAFISTRDYIIKRFSDFGGYATDGKAEKQLDQAIIGLGNGGILGVGLGNSYQKELFLPESYGDFIYAIIGEEYGMIGAVLIIIVFCFMLFRGYRVARDTSDEFGKYLAFGITTIIASYAVVNMSVATGIIPTTGVPIPFVSYGGTALIINSAAIGILLNISRHRDKNQIIPNKLNLKD